MRSRARRPCRITCRRFKAVIARLHSGSVASSRASVRVPASWVLSLPFRKAHEIRDRQLAESLAGIQSWLACWRYCFWFNLRALHFFAPEQIVFEQPRRWLISGERAADRLDIEPAGSVIDSDLDWVALLAEVCNDAASTIGWIFHGNRSRRALGPHDANTATRRHAVVPREPVQWGIVVGTVRGHPVRGHTLRIQEVVNEKSAPHRCGGARRRHCDQAKNGYRSRHVSTAPESRARANDHPFSGGAQGSITRRASGRRRPTAIHSCP